LLIRAEGVSARQWEVLTVKAQPRSRGHAIFAGTAARRIARIRELVAHLWACPAAQRIRRTAVLAVVCLVLMAGDSPALADDGSAQLGRVIDNARLWVVGLLTALGTFFLAVGGVRYLTSGGDPGAIEKAKTAWKSAAIGYAAAVLAPVLMTALKSIVGG
jgi:hypothetical protein